MASLVTFSLTSSAYQDVSVGFGSVWFILPFQRHKVNAVRLAVGQSLPSAGTANYLLLNPNVNEVGSSNIPQDIEIDLKGLASTDRVYLRADSIDVSLPVLRI